MKIIQRPLPENDYCVVFLRDREVFYCDLPKTAPKDLGIGENVDQTYYVGEETCNHYYKFEATDWCELPEAQIIHITRLNQKTWVRVRPEGCGVKMPKIQLRRLRNSIGYSKICAVKSFLKWMRKMDIATGVDIATQDMQEQALAKALAQAKAIEKNFAKAKPLEKIKG